MHCTNCGVSLGKTTIGKIVIRSGEKDPGPRCPSCGDKFANYGCKTRLEVLGASDQTPDGATVAFFYQLGSNEPDEEPVAETQAPVAQEPAPPPPAPKAEVAAPATQRVVPPGPMPAPKNPASRFQSIKDVANAFLHMEVLGFGRCKEVSGGMMRDCIVHANAPHLCQTGLVYMNELHALTRPGSNGSIEDLDAAHVGFCKSCVENGKSQGVIFSGRNVAYALFLQAKARREAEHTRPARNESARTSGSTRPPAPARPAVDPDVEQKCSHADERGKPSELAAVKIFDAKDYPGKRDKTDGQMRMNREYSDLVRKHGGDKFATKNCPLHGELARAYGAHLHLLYDHKPKGTTGKTARGKTLDEREAARAARSAEDRARHELIQKGVKTYEQLGHKSHGKNKGGRNGRANA